VRGDVASRDLDDAGDKRILDFLESAAKNSKGGGTVESSEKGHVKAPFQSNECGMGNDI